MKDKDNLVYIAVSGVVLIALILAFGQFVGEEAQRVMSVSGSASVSVMPDKADIFVKITSLEDRAADAQRVNAESTSRVIAALKKAGVSEEDIETSSFRLYPKQKWDEDEETYEIVGYEVIHVLKVETLNVKGVGDLVDKAVEAGADGIDRVSFSLTKARHKVVTAQALEAASSDAQNKSKAISERLGVRVGKISRISESNLFYETYEYYPREAELEYAAAVPELATPLTPGEVEVRANIELVYAIR